MRKHVAPAGSGAESGQLLGHDDIIKWRHSLRYGPFVWEFTGHRWITRTKASDAELWFWSAPWISGWVNNREAGDLRRHHAYYDVIVMQSNVSGHIHQAHSVIVPILFFYFSATRSLLLCSVSSNDVCCLSVSGGPAMGTGGLGQ